MKKKIVLIIFIIFVLLTGTIGVYAMTGGKIFEKIHGLGAGFIQKGSMDDTITINVNGKQSLDIITKEYELLPLLSNKGIMFGIPQLNMSSIDTSLYTFNQDYPIEYIRKIDGNNILAIYKTKDPANNIVYMYCFFDNINADDKRDTECWVLKSHMLFACKKVSYSDFKDIKVGSDIKDVYTIDSVVSKYCNIDNSFPYTVYTKEEVDINSIEIVEEDTKFTPRSYHLLTDGLLTISYEYNDGTFSVSDISYSKDYRMYDELSKKEELRKVLEHELPAN